MSSPDDTEGQSHPGGELEKSLHALGVPPTAAPSLPEGALARIQAYAASARPESALDGSTRAAFNAMCLATPPPEDLSAVDWASPIRLEQDTATMKKGAVISLFGLLLHASLPTKTFERLALAAIAARPPGLFATPPDLFEAALHIQDWSLFQAFARHGRATPKVARAMLTAGFIPNASDLWAALSSSRTRDAVQTATLLWDSQPEPARTLLLDTLQQGRVLGLLSHRLLSAESDNPSQFKAVAAWLLRRGVSGFAIAATGITADGSQAPLSFYDVLAANPATAPWKNELMNVEIGGMAERALRQAPGADAGREVSQPPPASGAPRPRPATPAPSSDPSSGDLSRQPRNAPPSTPSRKGPRR